MCAAQWLEDMDTRGRLGTYSKPLLTDSERATARLEGWILGVY